MFYSVICGIKAVILDQGERGGGGNGAIGTAIGFLPGPSYLPYHRSLLHYPIYCSILHPCRALCVTIHCPVSPLNFVTALCSHTSRRMEAAWLQRRSGNWLPHPQHTAHTPDSSPLHSAPLLSSCHSTHRQGRAPRTPNDERHRTLVDPLCCTQPRIPHHLLYVFGFAVKPGLL